MYSCMGPTICRSGAFHMNIFPDWCLYLCHLSLLLITPYFTCKSIDFCLRYRILAGFYALNLVAGYMTLLTVP